MENEINPLPEWQLKILSDIKRNVEINLAKTEKSKPEKEENKNDLQKSK